MIDVTDKTAEEEKEEEKKRIGEQLSFFSVCSMVSLLISLHPSSNFCRIQLWMFFSEFFFTTVRFLMILERYFSKICFKFILEFSWNAFLQDYFKLNLFDFSTFLPSACNFSMRTHLSFIFFYAWLLFIYLSWQYFLYFVWYVFRRIICSVFMVNNSKLG